MLDRLREEQTSRIGSRRLVELPQEQVLVELVEEEEGRACEAVDHWRDDRVAEC